MNAKHSQEIAFGILAGGAGRRVGGADKGWLLRDGRPQIEALIDAIRSNEERLGLAPSRLLISANRNLDDYARLGDAVIPDGDEFDQFPGPLIGVMRLLQAIQPSERLITLPVDAVPDETLNRAIHSLLAADANGAAVVTGPDGPQPPFASYPASLGEHCQRAVAAGERGMHHWQQRIDTQWLWLAHSPGNANQPGDYDPVGW
ncbi:MAG: NTP transferase domain-containing protein [Xanthomonadales bacterium]|nr:NTP transferase domain-containing protein [Xanthomonadales bacterium]